MNIKELYASLGGDYEDVISRLGTDERVRKYLVRFTQTPDFSDLNSAVQNSDWEKAFIAAHTLKGMALNLGFSNLASAASDLTEELRGGLKSQANAAGYYSRLSEEYNRTVDAINLLQD